MTGNEFNLLRLRVDVGYARFGMMLGFKGPSSSLYDQIRRYERMSEIPADVAARAGALLNMIETNIRGM